MGGASLSVAGTTVVVVGLATAVGWAGLSRPTTNAVATPMDDGEHAGDGGETDVSWTHC